MDELVVASPILGDSWRVLVQRPEAGTGQRLPWLWLLHGSTSTADELRPLLVVAASAMSAGDLCPMIIAAPDAPEGYRSSWWVDSTYAPPDGEPLRVGEFVARPGRALERALLGDVLPAVEEQVGPPPSADQRIIGGISMGGATALRWVLVRPDLFGSAVLLSPAAYEPLPPDDASARATGAFGVGGTLFDPDRFRELMHYPTLLDARQPSDRPTRVVIIVGDEEPMQVSGTRRCDLDLEAARVHAALKVRTDLRSSLRVVAGGHEWPVWENGIVQALRLVANVAPVSGSAAYGVDHA